MAEIHTIAQLMDAMKSRIAAKERDESLKKAQYAAHGQKKEERHFCVSLAGHIIEINSMYPDVYSLCEEYLCDGEPEIRITITDEDIAFERTETKSSAGYLETLAVYRKICTALLDYGIILMHGAVISDGQNAYMFTAKSGTGKTTHIRKWLDQLPDAYVVNGDKPLIRVEDDEIIACGTPWCGKENMGTNKMAPLKAIVLMERGDNNEIHEITFGDAFTFLLQQTYQPAGAEDMKKTLRLFSQLKGRVKIYKFVFNNMKDDCFDVAYNALMGDNK